jgi:hypothetical protein
MLDVGFLATIFVVCLYFSKRAKPDNSLFNSESVILHVTSLYVNAAEAVNWRAALSDNIPEFFLHST